MKYAILGFGFMGQKHFNALKNIKNAEVVALIDQQKCRENISHFSSLEDFLAQKPSVDIVIISTPNSEHYPQAKKILSAGYSILIEKPYTLTHRESEDLIHLSTQFNQKIFFSHSNRYSPVADFLKNLIKNEKLGKLFFLQVNLFWSRDTQYYLPKSWKGTQKQDGGTLYTQFFHFLDLIFWIFGDFKIKNVALKTLKHQNLIEIEDTGFLGFELKNGALGTFNFTTAALKNTESSMNIIAERASVKISGQYFDQIEILNSDNEEITPPNNPNSSLHPLEKLHLDIQEKIKNPSHKNNIEENFYIIKKIEEIYKKTN